jgi:PAS domain S-box-containing protein
MPALAASAVTGSLDTILFEGSPDCVKLVDTEGRLLAMNRNGRCAMEITDFSAIEGKAWASMWPGEAQPLIEGSLATAARGEIGEFSAFCPTAAGTPRWWDVRVIPLHHPDGRLNCFMSVSRDISAIHLANEELAASRARFALLVTQAPTGVLEADPGGRITFVNAKLGAMLGYSEQELLGRSILDITQADSVAATAAGFESLKRGGPAMTIEKRYLRKDGAPMWASSSVNALRGADGAFGGIVVIVIDITDRKAAEDKLRQADQRKDEFLAMLAHELRNPLAPIGSAAEYLGSAQLPPDAVRKASDIIIRQVAHMTSLVDDLLDVSRVTGGLVELDMRAIDIASVIHDAVEQVAPLMRARGHRLTLHLPDGPVCVRGDQKRLVQVLANLLNNAAKYTEPGGAISLVAEADVHTVTLDVSDNGIGIDAAVAGHVFDLFTQAKRTSDRSSGGLGLGLALVRSLSELHGGTVTCTSAGSGQGSRFRVQLPLLAREGGCAGSPGPLPAPLSAPVPESASAAQAVGRRVVIVDDNVDAGDMLAMVMSAHGHASRVERDAAAALARAAGDCADVSLLDIGLPGMDGIELARRLRLLPAGAHATLIAVSGYGQDSDRAAALAAGFDAYLVKPVEIVRLLELVGAAPVTPDPDRVACVDAI